MHRAVTTKNFLQDMFLRCDTKKKKITQFDGYRFSATSRKKGIALHGGVGSSMVFFSSDAQSFKGCQLTIQPSFEYEKGSRFRLFNTVVFSFLFFAFRPNAPLVFCENCGRNGNDMLRERNFFCHEKVGSIVDKKKRWRRTFLESTDEVIGITGRREERKDVKLKHQHMENKEVETHRKNKKITKLKKQHTVSG